MPESQMETSSSVDPKPKKSLFDEDVGKDFLSSWKSISILEGDTMDFNFDTVSTGKKKSFNFDKSDMDFNLDGDFDKLSSFKLDMPDLDFSSPSNKAAKHKERAGGESSNIKSGKQDSFTFSFDFNDLDNFDLDSSLPKGAKVSTKNLECKGFSSDEGDSQGSKTNVVDVQLDNRKTEQLPASDNGVTLMVESAVGGTETKKSLSEKFPSISETFDDQIVSESNSVEEVEKRNQQNFSLGKKIQAESNAKQITQCVPAQSLGGDHLTKDSVLQTEKEDGFTAGKANVESPLELNDNEKMITSVGSDHENAELINPSPECDTGSESNRSESKILKEIIVKTELMVDGKATPAASVSKTMSHESKTDKDVLHSNSEVSVPLSSDPVMCAIAPGKESGDINVSACQRSKETEPPPCQPPATGMEISSFGFKGTSKVLLSQPEAGLRETVPDKLSPIQENEPAVVCSKIYGISEKKTEPQLCQPSASVGGSSVGSKGVSDVHLTHTETGKRRSKEYKPQLCQPSSGVEISSSECREISSLRLSLPVNRKQEGTDVVDADIGRKLVSGSQPLPSEFTRGPSTHLGSYKNVKTLYNIRDSYKVHKLQNERMIAVERRPPNIDAPEGDPASLGSRTELKNLNSSGETFKGETEQNGEKLGGNPIPDNEAPEEDPAALGRRTYITNLNKSRCGVNHKYSTDKPIKLNTKHSLKHGMRASTQNSKIIVEGLEDEKISSDCSSLRISRNTGASKDQLKSSRQAETNLSRNTEDVAETQENKAKSEKHVHRVASSERKTPVITCLKRKIFEVTSTDAMHLNPHKRLSMSPNESRIIRVSQRNIKQVSNHNDQSESDTMNILYDRPTPGLDIPQANMKDLEVSLAIENDGNAQKAEVYAKELENICNMLKKKHEEAKELSVRAVVNNNSLLMLNHPIFDEKIRWVEKFAAQLRIDD